VSSDGQLSEAAGSGGYNQNVSCLKPFQTFASIRIPNSNLHVSINFEDWKLADLFKINTFYFGVKVRLEIDFKLKFQS
jgi:hypothetical protein